MSTEEVPAILLRRCRERNCIRLKKEYLQSWKERRSSPISSIEVAYDELVSDFKKTDIATTSEPIIAKDNGELPDSFPSGQFHQGVVLQIQDTWDISHSLFSQLNNLKDGTKRGDVTDMYGGDMLAELQKRIKEQLDATTEPNSPMPTDTNRTNINRDNTNHTNTNRTNTNRANTNHTNINNINAYANTFNNTHTDPRLAAELNDLNNVDMSQFDDEFDDPYEDTVMGEAMDEFDDDLDFNDHSINQTIPSALPLNNDSDDDFVTTQPVRVRPRLSKKPAGESSTQRPTTANAVSDLKRFRDESETTSSKRLKDETEDKLLIKKEKATVVDNIHWIDPSTWLDNDDDDDEEIDGVEIKPDGTTHVTFEALHRILGQMRTDSFTGSIADRITVHAKFIQMARMKFSKLTGFYALFDIGDPLENNKEAVRILIGNKLFMELLSLDPKNVSEIGEAIKDLKKAKKILVPFNERMRAKQLEVQLNINIMEKELSDDGTGEHFVPPTFSLKVLST
ncbi:hypothetical protein MFLAVUS_000357 [Mucor flavus]|uniref:Uncharacterized protein n=1 Tax=Mucor flavus TaxID=439312 RepID=A0ABP9YJH5_9FUNG